MCIAMKTQDAFLQLELLLRKHWTKHAGTVMRLQRAEDDSAPMLLCVGRIANTGLRAEFCKLWQGDKLLWQGPINHPELLALLHQNAICFGELNTASKLDVKNGQFYCFGNPEFCQQSCLLKDKHVKPSPVQCTDEAVRTGQSSQ